MRVLVLLFLVMGGCIFAPVHEDEGPAILQEEPFFGPRGAKVEVVEFSNYGCLTCKMFHDTTFQEIKEDYGTRVKYIHRNVPGGQASLEAALAAECAHEQGMFWEYHDALFMDIREWSLDRDAFYRYALDVGLEEVRFRECLDTRRYQDNVLEDLKAAREYGVIGTPTLYVNGIKVPNTKGYDQIKDVIDGELEKSG